MNIGHDAVHRRSFAPIGRWTLRGIVAELVTFKTRHVSRVTSFRSLWRWELWQLIPRPVWWWVVPRCIGVPLAIAAAVVVVPPVVAGIAVAVASIISGVSPIIPIVPIIVVMVIVIVPVVAVAVAAVISTVIVVVASSVRGSWAVVIVIPIGIAFVLSRIRVPGLDLTDWCG